MKKIDFIWIAVCSILLTNCIKDNGNYSYDEIKNMEISGFQSFYTLVAGIDFLDIPLELKGHDVTNEYEYTWTIYSAITNSLTMDTLNCKTDHLITTLNYTPGTYTLTVKVHNSTTGVDHYRSASVDIITEYSNGWYFLKEIDGNTDVDYESSKGLVENVLKSINKESLTGKPVSIKYQQIYNYIDEENNTHRGSTFFIQSQHQMKSYRIYDMVKIRDYYNSFYKEENEKYEQVNLFATFYNLQLIDKGGVYSLKNSSKVGKFGMPRANDKKYEISPNGICKTTMEFMLYDDLNGRYLHGYYMNNSLSEYDKNNQYNIKVAPYNLNYKMVFMGFKTCTTDKGDTYFVLEDKDDPKKKVIHAIDFGNVNISTTFGLRNPIKEIKEVSSSSELINSNLVCNNRDLAILYFAVSNKLYYYPIAGGEKLMMTYEDGEEITHINHFKNTADFKSDNLIVATHKNGRYKIYKYNFYAGMIAEDPVISEGNGKIKDVLYVSTKASANTAPYK